jgi:hypothetical protein
MAPDSNTETGAPPPAGAWSTMAGIRLYPVVRRDLQEIRCELLTLADVDRNNSIRQPGFFKKHGDLVAVWRRPVVKVDHVILRIVGVAMGTGVAVPVSSDATTF